jgi:hypothetical protein
VSGAATVIVALRAGPPPGPGRPPRAVETTTAASRLAPLSVVIASPALNPIALATEMTVAPAFAGVSTVVAPAVATTPMTAVSFAPASIMIDSRGRTVLVQNWTALVDGRK